MLTTDAIDNKRIKEYYEKLHYDYFNNLDEMNKIPLKKKLPKLTQEEIDK